MLFRRMRKVVNRMMGRDDGAVLIEFTLLAPFLVVLAAGFVEFGNALYEHHTLEQGLRSAGRYLGKIPSFTATSACTPATASGNQLNAINLAIYGNIAGTGTEQVKGWATATNAVCVTGPTSVSVGGGIATVQVVTLTADVTYSGIVFLDFLDDWLGLGGFNMTASHTQPYIGE